MSQSITTTIRWDENELNDIKKAAKNIGLPTSLFVKSIVLSNVRFGSVISHPFQKAFQEIQQGEFDVFDSPQSCIEDLRGHIQS